MVWKFSSSRFKAIHVKVRTHKGATISISNKLHCCVIHICLFVFLCWGRTLSGLISQFGHNMLKRDCSPFGKQEEKNSSLMGANEEVQRHRGGTPLSRLARELTVCSWGKSKVFFYKCWNVWFGWVTDNLSVVLRNVSNKNGQILLGVCYLSYPDILTKK